MSATKAGRILKRTAVGFTLALTAAGILAWTHHSQDGKPLFLCAAAVLLAALWEASRMGSLALRDLLPALLVPAAGVLLLGFAAVDGHASVRPSGWKPNLPLEYLWAGTLAAAAFSLARRLRAIRALGDSAPRLITYLVLGAIVWFATPRHMSLLDIQSWFALAIILVTTVPLVLREPGGAKGLLVAVGLALWIVPPLPALWHVWSTWSTSGLVAFLLLSKIGDTAGYYVGNAIGRRHPFPTISPGKTVAGCVGSLVAATLAGGACVAGGLLPDRPLGIAGGLLAGALMNLAAQSGDLLESWVKRRAGVKDSSRVFGPSGGVLDQIDSLLLTVPMAVATWPWIFARS